VHTAIQQFVAEATSPIPEHLQTTPKAETKFSPASFRDCGCDVELEIAADVSAGTEVAIPNLLDERLTYQLWRVHKLLRRYRYCA
jgi:hypothetical protein